MPHHLRLLVSSCPQGYSGHRTEGDGHVSPIGNELAGVVEGLLENAGFNQLARARKEGMVEFESCDPGDDLDIIASCVIMAKLAETGQTPDEPRMESILDVFFGRLSVYLSSGRDYLLFDEQLASLMESAISLGLVRPAQGPTARSAQAMGASGLMGRLPTFPDATVDEVLDIRSDLDPLVANLRSAIVTVSRTFTSRPWESSFRDELHDSWVETVGPAIANIDAAVRDNRSMLHLSAGLVGTAKEAWPGIVILGAGMHGHVPVASILGGTLAVANPLLASAWQRHVAQRDIQQRPFYFLYQLGRTLRA